MFFPLRNDFPRYYEYNFSQNIKSKMPRQIKSTSLEIGLMFKSQRCRDNGLKYWKVSQYKRSAADWVKNTIETSKFSTVVILVILTGMTSTVLVHQPFYFEWNSCISWYCGTESPGWQSIQRWRQRWWRILWQSPGEHSLCLRRRQWHLPLSSVACHWRLGPCR